MFEYVEKINAQRLALATNQVFQITTAALAQGATLPVYHSQNVDGPGNEALYARHRNRVKHL